MRRNWIAIGAGVLTAYMLVTLWPEIERYRRLRAM